MIRLSCSQSFRAPDHREPCEKELYSKHTYPSVCECVLCILCVSRVCVFVCGMMVCYLCVCVCVCVCVCESKSGNSKLTDSQFYHNTIELHTSLIADKNEHSAVSFSGKRLFSFVCVLLCECLSAFEGEGLVYEREKERAKRRERVCVRVCVCVWGKI